MRRVLLLLALAWALGSSRLLGQGLPIVGAPSASYVPSASGVAAGGTFTIDVSFDLTGVMGTGCAGPTPMILGGYSLPISFPTAKLELLGVTRCPGAPDEYGGPQFTNVTSANTTGTLLVLSTNGLSQTGPTGGYCYARIRFQVKAGATGTATVTFGDNDRGLYQLNSALIFCGSAQGPVTIPATLSGSVPVNVCTPPATPTASNGGPICQGRTLTLQTASVPNAAFAWTGPNGFSSTQQNPTIPNATPAATGSYGVTVTVAGCTSLAGTTNAVVNADLTPPVVTPPAPASVTVNPSACSGAQGGATLASLQTRYPSQFTALSALVNGGSAAEECSTATRLATQLGGADVTSATFFPTGVSTVSIRYTDVAGNVGTASGSVTVRRQGDLDASGVVDVFDVVTLASYIVGNIVQGPPPFVSPLDLADANGDRDVDVFDIVLLSSFVVGNVSCLTP